MKPKLHWLIYDPESPLTDHSLEEGVMIRFKKDYMHNWLGFKKGDRVRYLGDDKYGTWIQVVAGIDSKSRSNPFQVQARYAELFEPVGHPIHLHDVLEKIIWEVSVRKAVEKPNGNAIKERFKIWHELKDKLISLWLEFGLDTSLQAIFFSEGVEWESPTWMLPDGSIVSGRIEVEETELNEETPKDRHVRALGELLIQLFTDGDMNLIPKQ